MDKKVSKRKSPIQNKIKCEKESYGMPRIASGLFSTVTPLQKCSCFDTELNTIFPLNIWSKTEANVELLGLETLKEFDGKTFWTRKRVPWKSRRAFFWQKKKTKNKSCSRVLHFSGPKEATVQNDHKEITIPQMNLGIAFITVCHNNSDLWIVHLDFLSFFRYNRKPTFSWFEVAMDSSFLRAFISALFNFFPTLWAV